MQIVRVLNNNAAIVVDDHDDQSVVLGKGIAHGRRPGDSIDPDRVDQVFVPDVVHPVEQLAAYLSDMPLEVVRVASTIADLAHEHLGLRVSQALILPIADHLSFAVAREAEGIEVDYPLRWEVTQLYPAELAVGRQAVQFANLRLHASLPSEEAIPLALHFVNAQFATEGLSRTVRMTERISQVLDVVHQGTGLTIDPESMSVARFVTHLRYLFVRMESGRQITDSSDALMAAIRTAHPDELAIATRIGYLLEIGGGKLSKDEVLYLTLHVARLVADVR